MTVPAPEPLYLGDGDRPLFAWLHLPAAEQGTGVGLVIVPPFGYEAVCAHRALRHLAICAAEAGVLAVRVDLDGTGDSAGDDLDPDRVGAWVASVGRAADLARARGASRVVFAGVRLGALIGSLAAGARDDVAGLVAIAPVVSGRRWLREMKALQQALGLAPAPPDRALPDAGVQEAIGFAISDETQAALAAIELDKQDAPPAPAVLVIDREDLPPSEKWIARLRGQGADVDARRMPGYVEMVLDPHKAEVPAAILAATVEFARTRPPIAGVAAAAPVVTARRATLGSIVEEPVVIGDALAAIVTRPAAGPPPAKALVLLNAGAVRRIGPNRLNVAIARRLAAAGALVVRVDLSGIGDSPPRPGAAERLVYHDHALDEVAAILRWCRARGVERPYVSGLCSGGYYALKSPAGGEPWAGAIIVNPGTPGTGIDDKPYESAAEAARYKQSVRSLASWKRLLRGEVDVVRLVRLARHRVTERLGARARDVARWVGIPLDGDVGSELVQLARRGVATTFVFCDREPGLVLFREQVGSTGARLQARGALSVRIVDGPDHTYTPRWSHPVLIAEIAAGLARGRA